MKLFARQGDLVIERLDGKLGEDLIPKRDVVFAGDSSGHRHRLLGEALVQPSTGRTTRFRIAMTTDLVHEKADGHETITLKAGEYEIRPLRERGDASDRAVED